MKKRTYKSGKRFATYNKYDETTLRKIVNYIKQNGVIPSEYYISPHQLEPFLKELYYEIIEMDISASFTDKSNLMFQFKFDEKKLEFINLSQPIQLTILKRFQIDDFDVLKSIAVEKIMEIIKKRSYDESKARLTSQIYENVYQALLRNFKYVKENEDKYISFIDLDLKESSNN